MLPVLLALALAAPVQKDLRARDIGEVAPEGHASSRRGPALEAFSDAEVARRLRALERANRRSFSDERALAIQALRDEVERRRSEREWDLELRRREAREAAANAELEARARAEAERQRAVDEVADRVVALARRQAEEEERERVEAEAAARRRRAARWTALGVAALLGLGGAAVWARRGLYRK